MTPRSCKWSCLRSAPNVGALGEILIRRVNDNFECNPYCDCRKVLYRYTNQELVLSEYEHFKDLGDNAMRIKLA